MVGAVGGGLQPAGDVFAVGQDRGQQDDPRLRGGAADPGEDHLQAQPAHGPVDGVSFVDEDQAQPAGEFGGVAQ
ncbi:hypothetical protein [Streptomyces sp. P9-A2]|uniref:hypothetical protein n=1 Tax=Streptomyces sp. P9-A2 TaxID=3072284 RepID=UPI002FC615AC